ncbi:MAG: NADH-quinone oxidoreductase subunit NuoH [Anaerolineales bacterium]|nr:NADH-quinone oxidoreductase subunit NuoH [Anaerolineales bacterium]
MGDPFSLIGDWINDLLLSLGLTQEVASAIGDLLGAAILGTFALVLTFFTIWLERKLVARIQDRLGPNRVGPFGLFQTVADFFKLITKEVLLPAGADKLIFVSAPLLVVMSVVAIWAVIPFAPTLFGSDINVGILYVVSIGSIGTLGIMIAGMSSNNKYALLGGFRTVAMMLSYAVPMIIAMLIPTLLAGSMGMVQIVEAQASVWFFIVAPVATLIFFLSSLAEVGRVPFDLLEAESEIVAGFHIEYSGMSFGMFFVAEFLHAFTISALTATLFLGGWQGPWAETYPILGLVYFLIKTAIVYFVVIWIRGTFPRIRIDQLNAFNWKFLVPLGLAAVIFAAIIEKAAVEQGINSIPLHIAGNLVLVLLTLILLRAYARSAREKEESVRREVMGASSAADQ